MKWSHLLWRRGRQKEDIVDEKIIKAAQVSFVREITEKVKWISEKVWPDNLTYNLEALNEIIKAARAFGVTETAELSEAEITELEKQIKPMRTLNMKEEARDLLVGFLEKKGLAKEIFHPVIG